jgi:pyruvate/2-oxoglutarate dehydrogenase complex dihydrolipoamide dehydrogenase (E3) component
METSVPGIYALGDLAAGHALKHTANAEARHIAKLLLGHDKHAVAYDGVPHAVFASPQVASVGLTERQAQQQGTPYITSNMPTPLTGGPVPTPPALSSSSPTRKRVTCLAPTSSDRRRPC